MQLCANYAKKMHKNSTRVSSASKLFSVEEGLIYSVGGIFLRGERMKPSVMLAQLEEQAEYLRGIVAGLEDAPLVRPPAPGRMSLKQTAAHLAHTNELFLERLELMLTLDDPPIKVIDAGLEDLEAYKRVDLERVLEDFVRTRRRLIERLRRLYPAEWARRAAHPEYHRYDVQMAVEHLLLHEAHHLYAMEQMRAAIDRWDQR